MAQKHIVFFPAKRGGHWLIFVQLGIAVKSSEFAAHGPLVHLADVSLDPELFSIMHISIVEERVRDIKHDSKVDFVELFWMHEENKLFESYRRNSHIFLL